MMLDFLGETSAARRVAQAVTDLQPDRSRSTTNTGDVLAAAVAAGADKAASAGESASAEERV
jgi:hypothetical protein